MQRGGEPEHVQIEPGWRIICVADKLDIALVGILAAVAGVLAQGKISLFAISTFDTDYFLVCECDDD